MTTAKLLQKQRLKAGLSQKELADRMGLTQSTITQYETGRRIPKMETLERFADALGCDLKDLTPARTSDNTKALSILRDKAEELARDEKLAISKYESFIKARVEAEAKVKKLAKAKSEAESEADRLLRAEIIAKSEADRLSAMLAEARAEVEERAKAEELARDRAKAKSEELLEYKLFGSDQNTQILYGLIGLLNADGQKKLLEYAEKLCSIEKYRI